MVEHDESGAVPGGPRRPGGALSAQVLDVLLLANTPLTADQVRAELARTAPRPLAYTTVVTVLSRLHAQGLADRFRTGRAHAYRAVTDPSRLAARGMHRLLDKEHDRGDVLASFVSELTPQDEEILRRLLGVAQQDEPPA